MKQTNLGFSKRLTAGFMSLILVVLLIPFSAIAIMPDAVAERIADPSTMDDWKHFFGSDVANTVNAGGVWVDKSVFTDASAFPSSIQLKDENNFLVALSAIAANKSIVGYSNIPTDTMLVLDLSGSMVESDSVADMVDAANAAIKELFAVNNHNRVGVVLYSGNSNFGVSNTNTATVILPLDRYSVSASYGNLTGKFLSYSSNNETVSVANGVKDSDGKTVSGNSKIAQGGTYIQNGLYKAWQEFSKVTDTKIEDGFQAGVTRMPIIVLMSDGAPTSATTSYTNVGNSNVGTGGTTNTDMAFLTQLTASYVRASVANKYGREPLFYTLGLNVVNDDSAKAVLDPVGSTQSLWASYKSLNSNNSTLSLYLPGTTGSSNPTYRYVSIYRNSLCTVEDYVDGYYIAVNNDQLIANFQKIVDEIIIQSRYYPTHLQGNDPDFGGYITFEDKIGEYMEVKDIKGILLGDTLFSGAMLTSKINTSSDGLGTVENPTALGDEFIRSIRTRLGIDLTEARTLAANAFEAGQLSYTSPTQFSNYIGWYADENGNYVDFWKEGMTSHPKNAVYINRSYGFLGTAEGNIKDSDMMYMTVQVHTNIISGHQTVLWKIPAALVPMVTYSVTLKGDSVENATDIKIDIIDAEPIRLVFETGLRSDINELNINEKMAAADKKHKTEDGYYFWTNDWDPNGSDDPYGDLATTAHFVPNVENERYYYTEDSDIYVKDSDGSYKKVKHDSASDFDEDETYYHARTAFELVNKETGEARKNTVYEKISATSFGLKQKNEDETWYIPRGTIYQEFEEFIVNKSENTTETLEYANVPYVILNTASYESASHLGNNGRLKVTPAQGIKISKSVDVVKPGTSTEFKFRITLDAPDGVALADEYTYVLAKTGEYEGTSGKAEVIDGAIEVTVSNNQTVFITDLPAGTIYTVEELNTNENYRLKSVTVNGTAPQNGIARGRVTEYKLDDVAFVNTPITRGGLVISKTVTHPFGDDYEIPDGKEFSIEVKLEGSHIANTSFDTVTDAGNGSVTSDANGIIRFKLESGEAVMINGIPEGTKYTVTETDLPDGFTLSGASEGLIGGISSVTNANAKLVNDYKPDAATPDISVVADKVLMGRQIKTTDSFEFVLRRYVRAERAHYEEVDRITLSGDDLQNGKLSGAFDMSGESFEEAGEYNYVISEVDASAIGNGIAGVTYDTAEMFFTVHVADKDMDGKLEIESVNPTEPTTVSGDSENGYTVSATFNNRYAPTVNATVEIDITKRIESPSGAEFGLNGFSFGLYSDDTLAAVSTVTDASGKAYISLSFPPSLVGQTINYTLKEIVHDTPIPGMTYSTEEYQVSIEIIDNGDGTVGAVIDRTVTDSYNATFTNTYDPTDAVLIISGRKAVLGRGVNEGEFGFDLYETDNSFGIDGLNPIATAENAYNGSFAFPMMTYDEVGSKYYVITETKGNLGGMSYDETVYTVEVIVDADNNGALVAHATIKANGVVADNIVFTNIYEATPTTVDIVGKKMLSGRDLNDGEFEFRLADANGVTLETVTHNEKGEFEFGTLNFDAAGVYKYTVTELKGDVIGVAYDDSVYTVTVTVTDNGIGALHAKVEYHKGNLSAGEIVFANSYSASPTTARFGGIKHLDGRTMNENEFAFVLINTGTNTVIETVYNRSDGSFEFSPRTYRAADVYHYTVTELNNMLGGISYDTKVYSVIVTVKDDGLGELKAEVEYKLGSETVEEMTFENTYKASPVSVGFAGVKTLSGRALDDGEFKFNLYETDREYNVGDTILETVENTADGEFEFEAITFETAGDRYYVITEQNTGTIGVTYDENVYRVKVSVTDNGLGELVAATEITNADGEIAETLVFANVYEPINIEVTIDVLKTVENLSEEEIGADGFEFVLVHDGVTVDKVVSDEAGDARFTLEFSDSDVGETFTYYVSETAGEMPYMAYSTAVHTYEIEIVYENGELKANVTKNGGADESDVAEFVNTYNGKPKTGDASNILPWVLMLILCGGAVVGIGMNTKKKQRNF